MGQLKNYDNVEGEVEGGGGEKEGGGGGRGVDDGGRGGGGGGGERRGGAPTHKYSTFHYHCHYISIPLLQEFPKIHPHLNRSMATTIMEYDLNTDQHTCFCCNTGSIKTKSFWTSRENS